jgi:hypothetical protein
MPTIDIPTLRARIAEYERSGVGLKYAPASVRAKWEFDITALKLLLTLIEKGER